VGGGAWADTLSGAKGTLWEDETLEFSEADRDVGEYLCSFLGA
jgi:hypothetical protein